MTLQSILLRTLRWVGVLLMLVILAPVQNAQAQDIKLSEIPNVNLLSNLEAFQGQAGATEVRTEFDFRVVNDSPDTVFWHFQTEVLVPLEFSFYVQGQSEPILQSPFVSIKQKSHASQGPVLVSDLIAMSPGEQLAFRAVFEKPPGPDLFPVRLISKENYEAQKQRRSLTHGMFFGAMMIFVVLFLLAPNFLLNTASNWFGIYLIATAFLTMHAHGYGLEYLSIAPQAYFPVTRLLHTCLMLSYLLFVLSFIKAAKAYRMYWRCVWAFIIVGISIAILEQVLNSADFQKIADLVPLTFLALGSWGAYLAFRDNLQGSYFFVAGFGVLVFGGSMNFLASLPSFAHWNEAIDQLTLLIQTSDALIFGGAILSQVYGLRKARDQATNAQLAETQRRLTLSETLLATQGDLQRTRELAERHRTNLASTSHDLRQPITSLRMSLELAKDRSPELVSEIGTAIAFLDQLLDETLAKTKTAARSQTVMGLIEQAETVELQVILQNAQRMFAAEAAQKGIILRSVDSSVLVSIPTIDLIRMISNLVSNAVRYTTSGGVLIGVRRRNEKAAVEVWDTGPGIALSQQEAILQPYVRSPSTVEANGEGLGLSIVKELADKNGLTLRVRSVLGKGSVFSIEGLPRARSANDQEF